MFQCEQCASYNQCNSMENTQLEIVLFKHRRVFMKLDSYIGKVDQQVIKGLLSYRLCSIDFYVSILLLKPYCLDYCSKSWNQVTWNLKNFILELFSPKIILAILVPLLFFINFRYSLPVFKKKILLARILIGVVVNLYINQLNGKGLTC